MMTDRELALADVRAVAGEAGDASGNADRALHLLVNGRDAREVLEALQWAEEQGRRLVAFAGRARARVAALTPNVELTGAGTASG